MARISLAQGVITLQEYNINDGFLQKAKKTKKNRYKFFIIKILRTFEDGFLTFDISKCNTTDFQHECIWDTDR